MTSMRTRALAIVSGLAVATSVGLAQPAQAGERDGRCESGEFCYFPGSGQAGSASDFSGSLADYGTSQPACFEYKGTGRGQGLCIKNTAASVWNRSAVTVQVHFNSGFRGTSQSVAPGAKVDLNSALRRQNASHRFVTGPTASYVARDDYPYKGQTSGGDRWNFIKGQCTSFSAWAINNRVGVGLHNYYKGPHWGNAINWDNAARSVGIPVTGTPRPGSVAVRNSGRYGHVAFVTRVHSNGTFEVDEYNYGGTSRYSHRTTRVGTGSPAYFDAFIHFR